MDGELERVKSLIQKGTQPNQRDSAGYTALVSLLARCMVDFEVSYSHILHPDLLLHFLCVCFSIMQVAAVISLYASCFLRMALVRLPRHQAVPHHFIGQLTVVIWMWLNSCCTTRQIQCCVMMMVHLLCIRWACHSTCTITANSTIRKLLMHYKVYFITM